MKHTPGPWIRSKHGFQVLTADAMVSIAAVNPGHWSVKQAEEQIANARLIATAPELLAALKTASDLIASAYSHISHGSPTRADALKVWEQCKAAISKAEGND